MFWRMWVGRMWWVGGNLGYSRSFGRLDLGESFWGGPGTVELVFLQICND